MQVWRMRTGISITVKPSERKKLRAISRTVTRHRRCFGEPRSSFDGGGSWHQRDHASAGKSKTCVWRWQGRFMTDGVEGLLRDKTRPSRVGPLGRRWPRVSWR